MDGNYTFFDYNDHVSTQGRSINKDGEIAGWAFQRKAPWLEFQFVRNPDGTITTTTLREKRMKGSGRPGAFTDNGQIIGYYEALRSDGNYTPPRGLYGHGANYERRIVLPFPGMGGIFASGVNNEGDVAGYFESCPGCDGVHGFVVKDDVATQIDYPDEHVISTAIYGINDSDLVIGKASYDDDAQIAFLYDLRNNRFKRLYVDIAYSVSNGGLIAVHNDGALYIYCLTKETCPGCSGREIEVHDRWIPGAAAPIAIPCDRHCLKPI